METPETLELQDVADELGVHYQTAYRWVRSGRLDAKMIGGRYVVERSQLVALDKARHTPTAPTAPSAARVDRSAGRVHDALVDGDEKTVAAIIGKLVDEGSSMVNVITRVIVPSLRRIGQAWSDGQIPVWTEHRASAIIERTLGEYAPNPRGRRRGTAMVTALSGDRHSLPTTMAAVALREDNWHVHHLGSDMPVEDVVEFCASHDISVAVITVTLSEAVDLATATAERLEAAGTPTLVGKAGLTLEDLLEQARGVASHRR